jgi:AGZA family xanthine/uracil permease-like MFS transporter
MTAERLERFFGLKEAGSTIATEFRAGATTFLTLSYILFVNPQILSQAGLPREDVVVATAIASATATLLMGLWANLPFALAPGMGLNAYFTFGVVGAMGVDWRIALAAVFIEGILFLILAVTGARSALVGAIPSQIKVATMAGIGLFLAMIGLQSAGVVVDHSDTLVGLGDLGAPSTLLALAGLLLMAALMTRKIRGGILYGILTVSGVAWVAGISPGPEAILTVPSLPSETLFALDFKGLLTGKMLSVILAFLFVDFFDTAGTLIGVGRLAGFLDDQGQLTRANRAFTADAVGTSVGALLGTSTVTSYVESATGVEEGGRTGLTAVAVASLFMLSLFFTPLLVAVPAIATAPALILVGALMMRGSKDLDWTAPDQAVPALLTIAGMPFTYSIANGITLGLVSFVLIRVISGRYREVHPLLYLLSGLLIAFYAFR